MANVRKYGYTKPVKINNPIRWTPKMPKGNKQMTKNAYGGSVIRRLEEAYGGNETARFD